MKKQIKPFLIAAIVILQSTLAVSQHLTDFSKIVIGRSYMFALFDETQIMGKVIGIDSTRLQVRTEDDLETIVPIASIVYYSKDLVPNKYFFSASFMGGVSLLSGGFFPFEGISGGITAPNFNLGMMWFFSSSKGLKLDAGYTYVKSDNTLIEAHNDSYLRETMEGGDVSIYSIKGNFLLGRFRPAERIILFVSMGIGVHITKQQAITIHYDYKMFPDSAWMHSTNYYEPTTDVNAIISVGGAAGYRITKNFGVRVEIEYNFITNGIFLGGNHNYFPLRAGLFYIL